MGIEVYKAVWEHSRASGGALLVLLYLAEKANNKTWACYPGVKKIAEMTKLGERQVKRHLRYLERAGEIATIRGGSDGKSTNHYRVLLNARGVTHDTPDESRGDVSDADGVTSEADRGVTGDAMGVSPMTPKPEGLTVNEPSKEPEREIAQPEVGSGSDSPNSLSADSLTYDQAFKLAGLLTDSATKRTKELAGKIAEDMTANGGELADVLAYREWFKESHDGKPGNWKPMLRFLAEDWQQVHEWRREKDQKARERNARQEFVPDPNGYQPRIRSIVEPYDAKANLAMYLAKYLPAESLKSDAQITETYAEPDPQLRAIHKARAERSNDASTPGRAYGDYARTGSIASEANRAINENRPPANRAPRKKGSNEALTPEQRAEELNAKAGRFMASEVYGGTNDSE